MEQLIEELKRQASAWTAKQIVERRAEAYLIQDGAGGIAIERVCDVEEKRRHMSVFDYHGEHMGNFSTKVNGKDPLAKQVADAIAIARKINDRPWTLPSLQEAPAVQSADPRMTEDPGGFRTYVIDSLFQAIKKQQGVIFNSAEIAVFALAHRLVSSTGIEHRSERSKVYVEVAFSRHEDDGRADEVLRRMYTTSKEDLDLETFVSRAAEDVRNITRVSPTVGGEYNVILRAGDINLLFHELLGIVSGAHKYLSLPFKDIGDALVGSPEGDSVTLVMDPTIPMGAETVSRNGIGSVCQKIELVRDNKVVGSLMPKRFADYLGHDANGAAGNVVLKPGSMDYAEMTCSGRTMEIVEFSALFVDPMTLTFSSEIRLGRVFDGQGMHYIKGGSVSGNLLEALAHARFSKDTTRHTNFEWGTDPQGYVGPSYLMLPCSVAGK